MAISIRESVGKNGKNNNEDVKTIQICLKEIDFYDGNIDGNCGPVTLKAIRIFQSRFMILPDQLISVSGQTIRFLNRYKIKRIGIGVLFMGNQRKAWDIVNPFLPADSYCSSAYRSPEDQRKILYRFFSETYKNQLIAHAGSTKYTQVWNNRAQREQEMVDMLRAVGQAIALPGASKHQKAKAVDVGGPNDNEQVRVIRLVAQANKTIFSGKILKERNGCVHFEIL